MRIRVLTLLLLMALGASAQYSIKKKKGDHIRWTTTTNWIDGWLETGEGEVMTGQIQLIVKETIRSSDTVTINIKTEDGQKASFDRKQLLAFAPSKRTTDFRVSRNPHENFHEGEMKLTNGAVKTGLIAIRPIKGQDKYHQVLWETPQKFVLSILPRNIASLSKTIDGEQVTYENFKGGFIPRDVDGPLIVIRNPFPTAMEEVENRKIDPDVEVKSTPSNADESSILDGYKNRKKAEEAEKQRKELLKDVQRARMQPTHKTQARTEFLVRRRGSEEWALVHRKNNEGFVEHLLAGCKPYESLDKKQHKDMLAFDNFVSTMDFYNNKCYTGKLAADIDEKPLDLSKEGMATRGGGDPLKGLNISSGKTMILGKYYALIIGIDTYGGEWAALENAVNDASAMAGVLKDKYRFHKIKELYDVQATRDAIIAEFMWLVENVKPEDNVLIFYSGHGEYQQALNKGFWVPVDAKSKSVAGYISNSDIQTFLSGIKSKHSLLVSDACFSGDIFRGNTVNKPFEDSERYYSEVHSLKSRQALTSGGIEPVMDGGSDGHSVFSYYLLKSLRSYEGKYLDAGQLYNAIKVPVANNSRQTPKIAPLRDTGDEGGQFVFIKK